MSSSGSQTLMENETLSATKVGDHFSLPPKSQEHVAVLKAANVNGATTVTGKVEHSFNGVDWFDLANFAALVGVAGAEVINITVGVLSQIRANVTLAGGTQAADVTVGVHYREKS